VVGLVEALRALVSEIARLERQVAAALAAHADAPIFQSLFRDPQTTVTVATLLAEIGDCRERYPTRESLVADAGMSPVTRASGKRRVVAFRFACDKRLRQAVAVLANASRQHHPWARAVYTSARSRGCDHAHALRILGRAWLRVIHQMWLTRTPYDPVRHGALQRLLAERG
jgi:transposase